MPNLAVYHPQVVHFAIALLFLGFALRVVSLTGRLKFTSPAAALLLLLGAAAATVAVRSGEDAHGPVERIPGARDLVIHHEDHGKDARNKFLIVAAIELLALGLAAKASIAKYARVAHFASALAGFVGVHALYETAELGGQLVYSYAGGPGLRSGDPEDVERLLLSGLYLQAQADRREGRFAESARLTAELAARFPQDTTIRFLLAESQLRDTKDFPAALATTRAVGVDASNARLVTRKASLTADIFLAMGHADSAKAVLAPVVTAFPQNTRLKAKLDSIQ